MMDDRLTAMIVRSTIELGHSLGLKVVAEGVEDEAAFRFLRQQGCEQAQGYFMSPALSAEKLEEWLHSSRFGTKKTDMGATLRISPIKAANG
jgi:EAL domain-containing protein (putative c-di-GMP-specific phosphodiesterase class I)